MSMCFWISAHKANDAENGTEVMLYSNSNLPLLIAKEIHYNDISGRLYENRANGMMSVE